MGLFTVAIPPGVFSNGTDLQGASRWRDGSLVRWQQGAMLPVGGWRVHYPQISGATPDGVPRGATAWADNSGGRFTAWGSYGFLYAANLGGIIYDITPTGLAVGDELPASKTGYGTGPYGRGRYGVPRPDDGSYTDATTWALDNWGENLIACSSHDQTIYEWDLVADEAVAVENAPMATGIAVTEERFLFALGADRVPNRLSWSDRENNALWAPDATNEAGSLDLQTPGRLMQGVRTRGATLFLTDNDAWAASYIGPPYVYGISKVGGGCGVASRLAACSVPWGVIWMGKNGFYGYTGGVVEPIMCEVLDELHATLDSSRISQAFAVRNSMFDEVWWYYPSEGSTECDSYVCYNYTERHWSVGKLARTAGIDRGVFDYPVLWAPDATIYDHEFQALREDGLAWAESGPIVASPGADVVTLTELVPDEEVQGEVTATFKMRYYPNGDETVFGPYEMSNPTSIRATGRQFRVLLEGKANKDFRVGIQRVRLAERGRR